jgi:hypothetical protein
MLFVANFWVVIDLSRRFDSDLLMSSAILFENSRLGAFVDRLLAKLLITVIGITLAATVGAAYF